ncbi:MAG: HAD-IA family hydrolase [Pseudomonadota bacterium]|uniref:HAD-IA family hydrolase n=1 Tax=Sphingomonas sp. ERG5 TaxID=1381597 RepID=UPI00054B6E85|nr:HAD-IA family hydrolase [Sphingomonas sp. ERG5]
MNRLALFDCDGTLVDSQASICQAAEEAFMLHRLDPPERSAIRRIVGLSLVEAMRGLLPHADDALHRALADDYKAAFFRLRTAGALAEEPLFDGMIAALDDLAAAGWVFGVATGKSDRGLVRVLDEHGIKARFVTLQTADRHPSKPHPSMIETAIAEAGASPETTVMIGDTSYDMMMARAGHVRALGVAWGYHPPEELIAAGADAIARTVADLPAHMAAI